MNEDFFVKGKKDRSRVEN